MEQPRPARGTAKQRRGAPAGRRGTGTPPRAAPEAVSLTVVPPPAAEGAVQTPQSTAAKTLASDQPPAAAPERPTGDAKARKKPAAADAPAKKRPQKKAAQSTPAPNQAAQGRRVERTPERRPASVELRSVQPATVSAGGLLVPNGTLTTRRRSSDAQSLSSRPSSRLSSASSSAGRDASGDAPRALTADTRTIIDKEGDYGRVTAVVSHIRFGRVAPQPGSDGCLVVFEFAFSPKSLERFTDATVDVAFASEHADGREPVLQAVAPREVKDELSKLRLERTFAGAVVLGAEAGGVSTAPVRLRMEKRTSMVVRDARTARGNGAGTPRAQFVYEENTTQKTGIWSATTAAVALSCPGGPFRMHMEIEVGCPAWFGRKTVTLRGDILVNQRSSLGNCPDSLQIDPRVLEFPK